MFFKGATIFVASRFLWAGLVFGCAYFVVKVLFKVFRQNVYLCNLVSFVYYLMLGLVFSRLCFCLNHYSFCFYGLLSMLAGWGIARISVDFVLTFFAKLLYSKVRNFCKRKKNGKLQASEKV